MQNVASPGYGWASGETLLAHLHENVNWKKWIYALGGVGGCEMEGVLLAGQELRKCCCRLAAKHCSNSSGPIHWSLPCARDSYFAYKNSCNTYYGSVKWVLLLSYFYRWRNWRLKGSWTWPKSLFSKLQRLDVYPNWSDPTPCEALWLFTT